MNAGRPPGLATLLEDLGGALPAENHIEKERLASSA
jgi:hypothetical protein